MIVLICILIVAFDQLSKFLFSQALSFNKSIPVIKNFLHFTLVHNTGIAFGVFKGSSKIILIVTIIGVVLIIYSLKKDFLSQQHGLGRRALFIRKMAVGFILGGAIGNMIDRFRLGYVIDFIDFRIWPVFNFADSFITIGAVILFWNLFFPAKSNKV